MKLKGNFADETFEAIGTVLFYYSKQHLLAEYYRLVVRDVGGITFFDRGLKTYFS